MYSGLEQCLPKELLDEHDKVYGKVAIIIPHWP